MAPADIDTAPPFPNVKAAVRMFGERGAVKPLSQKHGACKTERCKLEEELVKVSAQLLDVQKERVNALLEVEELKKCLEASGVNCVIKEECRDDAYAMVLAELQALKREMSVLKQHLCVALQEKENAIKQAEEALSAAEVNAKRAEELSNEISGTKESLLLVRMACIEANNDRKALLAAKNALSSGEQTLIEISERPIDDSPIETNNLEIRHNGASNEEEISKELGTVQRNLIPATGAHANIDKLKAGYGSPVTDATIAAELATAKTELSRALDNDALIESNAKELQDKFKEVKELDATKAELRDVRNREAHAITVLKSELKRTKEELRAALSCNKTFVGLSQKLENFAVLEEEENVQAEDEFTVKVHDEAKAELYAMLKAEVEAARGQAELHRRKTSQAAQQHTIEAAYKASRDNPTVLSEDKNLNSFPESHYGESLALESWMRNSYKEELKKKKVKLPLPSFSALLSRSKRGSRKGMNHDM